MPEYQYEALDASGKSVTGTISCRGEQQALEGLDKSGLHPTKLTLREDTPARPIVRIVAGLLGILFFWFFFLAGFTSFPRVTSSSASNLPCRGLGTTVATTLLDLVRLVGRPTGSG